MILLINDRDCKLNQPFVNDIIRLLKNYDQLNVVSMDFRLFCSLIVEVSRKFRNWISLE